MPRMRWVVPAAICACVVVSFIPAYSFVLRKNAESLVRNVSTVSRLLGEKTTVGIVQAIYKGELTRMPNCTPAFCEYEVVESNRVLAALHWSPYSELRSEIWLRDGILSAVILHFTSNANPHHTIVSHVYVQEGKGLEFDLDPWEKSSPADANGIVGVSPESLQAHEQAVLGFDTKCLTSRRGCTSIAELLPTIWEQTKDGWIRCRVVNHKGFVESPWR